MSTSVLVDENGRLEAGMYHVSNVRLLLIRGIGSVQLEGRLGRNPLASDSGFTPSDCEVKAGEAFKSLSRNSR